MSFLSRVLGGGGGGGGGIASANIVIGAQTAVLRSQVHSALSGAGTDIKTFATEAQVSGNRAAAGVNKIGTAAETSSAKVAAATRQGSAAMKAGAVQAETSGKRWASIFNLIGNAAKIGMLGVVAAVGLGVKSAADFEKQWAAVIKTVGGSPKVMAKLREDIFQIAQTMPVSTKDLAGIAETAGALGVPIPTIKEFVRVTAMIGATTNVSVDQAATSLGVLGNIVHLRTEDYRKFASALVDLGNKGASTEKQILDITQRSAAAGKLLGLRTQDILAISSTAASVGIAPEAGGTALSTIYSQLIKVTAAEAKAGKGGTDLTKTRQQLAVAEQRLSEQRANSHTKLSTIMASENRIADLQKKINAGATAGTKGTASGAEQFAKVAGISAKAWKDLLKDHPEQAFLQLLTGLGKLTAPEQLAKLKDWGMSGTRVARVMQLLSQNPKELARQLGIADAAWTKGTAAQEAYERKTANLIDRLKILGNVIQVQLIKLGDILLPVITKIVDAFANGLPHALAAASTIWDAFWKKVQGPVGKVLTSIGHLLSAFSGGDGGKPIDWADAIASAFDGLANVIASIANGLASIIDIGAEFVASPLGQWAKNILIPLAAVAIALSGLRALAGKLTGMTTGILKGAASFLPGLPKFGNQPMTPEAQALTGAGTKLTGSALELDKAALAIQKAVGLAYGENVGGPISGITPAQRTRRMTTAEQMAYAGEQSLDDISAAGFKYPRVPVGSGRPGIGFDASGRVNSVPISGPGKADYLADQRKFDAAGKSLIERASLSLASGMQTAAGVGSRIKSAASSAFGLIKGAGSLISKAFWPLMLADMATEFLKAPIADFVGNATGFKNVAKLMATDFWGGAVALLTSALNGTDAWVGHAEITNIGKAKISTLTIAKLGFTSAEIGNIQAPTLANGGFDLKAQAAAALRAKYQSMSPSDIIAAAGTAGIDVSKYSFTDQATKGKLGNGVLESIESSLGDAFGLNQLVQNAGLNSADVQPLIDKLVGMEFDGLNSDMNTAVEDALQKLGYSKDDVAGLPQGTLSKLGHLIGANVGGKIDGLVAFAARAAIEGSVPVMTLATSAQIARNRQGADLTSLTPPISKSPFYSPVGGLAGGALTGQTETALQRTNRGGDRGRGVGVLGYTNSIGNTQVVADANTAFTQNLAKVLQPMKDTYARWLKNVTNDPTGNRQAAADTGQRFLDLYGKAIEGAGKTPPKNTRAIVAMAESILGPTAITKNKKGVTVLAAGAWNQIWDVYNEAANTSGTDQRKRISETLRNIIVAGAKDGSSTAAEQMKSLFFTDNKKAVDAAIAALAADPKSKALDKLLATYNTANPSAQIGGIAGFKTAYAAWKKTGMLDPTATIETSTSLKEAKSEMEKVADAATTLAGAMTNLVGSINLILDRVNNPGDTRSGGGGGRGRVLAAGGAFFDTRGTTHMTVGEAGGETVAVIRNPRRFMLPDMRMPLAATPGFAGAGGGGGRPVQIFTDKMQVLGPADEQSLLERFAFLSNQ